MDGWEQRPGALEFVFLDAMSMLALMHSGSESAKAATEFASVTKKVGYSSPDEALVVTSFSLKLPEAFGSLPNSGVTWDSWILLALLTFKEWDGGDGYNSLKITLSDKLTEFVPQMGSYYRTCLTGEALTIANEMLAVSKNFINEFSTWMHLKYQDMLARTMACEKEAWSLITHCVRVIFKLLRDAQLSGSHWTPEASDGDVQLVWAQLQCHQVMHKLRVAGFSAHPVLSHVLNLHLQDNVASRSKFEVLEKKGSGNGEAGQGGQEDCGMKRYTEPWNGCPASCRELMGAARGRSVTIIGAESEAVMTPRLRGVSGRGEGLCGGSPTPPGGANSVQSDSRNRRSPVLGVDRWQRF